MTPDEILSLALWCRHAYDPAAPGMIALHDGQEKDRGFAIRARDQGVVVFAGSESILDWLTDFQCLQTDYLDFAAVHFGFLNEFRKVWPQIDEIFRGMPVGYPISVAGHSLGGALATFAAHAFYRKGYKVRLLTLGSPRVGDANFAKAVNAGVVDSVRIQHHNDLVCRVPKIWYRHVDGLVRLDDDGKPMVFAGVFGALERIFEVAKADLQLSAGVDHLIDRYIPAVEKYVKNLKGERS